jgi:hypothetical protein
LELLGGGGGGGLLISLPSMPLDGSSFDLQTRFQSSKSFMAAGGHGLGTS